MDMKIFVFISYDTIFYLFTGYFYLLTIYLQFILINEILCSYLLAIFFNTIELFSCISYLLALSIDAF